MAWARHLPLLLLAGVFIWALVTVNARSVEQAPPGTTVLRIGHWQLEASVRDAFRILGDEFSNLPEIRAKFGKVKVIQDAIPEGVYGQWITSQMMGQTAPDLVEIGVGLPPTIWLAYQNRYFEPLTVMAGEPNPYNKGTPLEGVPLQNTFVDGMRTGYTEELQEFMRAPLSRTSQRLFYNADLLEKLTGSRTPPKTYRQLLAACEQIAAQKTPAGKVYVPIASSAYNITLWEGDFLTR